ncbi:MAG: ParB/RepB/Spo0J family partition protein [Sphingorhabdus sp.]
MSVAGSKPLSTKKGLGRGLDALLGEALRDDSTPQVDKTPQTPALKGVSIVAIAQIKPNPKQPRRHFDDDALSQLGDSIKRHGLVQPIVLRPKGKGYQIVAGERRWRAAQKVGLHELPAIIRDYDDGQTLEIALVENIQRKDLNPIEEAEAYKRLSEEFGHSQAALAKIVDKSRSHVANIMRLLDLPRPLRDLVIEEKLTMGHARALLGSDEAVKLAAIVVRKGLSVRATEALVKKNRSGGRIVEKKAPVMPAPGDNADIHAVEVHLGDLLGLHVKIVTRKNGKAGSVTFDYNSLDQLDMLCQRLTGESF